MWHQFIYWNPQMKGKTYQNNHLITQTVEANECTIEYTKEEDIVIDQIFSQTYSLTKGINNSGDKGLYSALSEVKQLHDRI